MLVFLGRTKGNLQITNARSVPWSHPEISHSLKRRAAHPHFSYQSLITRRSERNAAQQQRSKILSLAIDVMEDISTSINVAGAVATVAFVDKSGTVKACQRSNYHVERENLLRRMVRL